MHYPKISIFILVFYISFVGILPLTHASNSGITGGNQKIQSKNTGNLSPAAKILQKLGKSGHVLIGTGDQTENIDKYGVKTEILDRYINGVGPTSWISWNSPSGAYIKIVTDDADRLHAVPMFTLYQMAFWGDSDLTGLRNTWYMKAYWENVRILFQHLGTYNKPSLINVEPDFWGYIQRIAKNNDAHTIPVLVKMNSDCKSLEDNLTGMFKCLLLMRTKYAPKALVGVPLSIWEYDVQSVGSFMKSAGVLQADFLVMQTLDRDAGCFESIPQTSYCSRTGTGWYWTPTQFEKNFLDAKKISTSLGNLPIMWWQTPMGVPNKDNSHTGSGNQWRDNRMEYFLSHMQDIASVGGFGISFSPGEVHQTDLTSDQGQYIRLSTQYWKYPQNVQ